MNNTKIDIFTFMDYDIWEYTKYWKKYPYMLDLKDVAGVYAFTIHDTPLYIGSSINLLGRFINHLCSIQPGYKYLNSKIKHMRKYYYLNKYINDIKFEILARYDAQPSKETLLRKEYELINLYCPIFNVDYGDYKYRWDGTEKDFDNYIKSLQNDGDDEI